MSDGEEGFRASLDTGMMLFTCSSCLRYVCGCIVYICLLVSIHRNRLGIYH